MNHEELYYRLKHKETRERLDKRAKICGPGEINGILSNKENQFVFQTEYKQFWEDTERGVKHDEHPKV
ncbi:hypothetical protein H1164_13135 [Thermoactinomyces daqus]|uniref:Uncharacterized protein n=1 Tax=Thermoactinomyces daqus TaxID=1329516 RepID=A0A7W1XC64_9BACL|nr:hypothetical protein [Thermoactinomyces daqus]MBA4543832.1 hypothetical protein [Thermoactinomyces daqus]